MVLHGKPCGRVGRCRDLLCKAHESKGSWASAFLSHDDVCAPFRSSSWQPAAKSAVPHLSTQVRSRTVQPKAMIRVWLTRGRSSSPRSTSGPSAHRARQHARRTMRSATRRTSASSASTATTKTSNATPSRSAPKRSIAAFPTGPSAPRSRAHSRKEAHVRSRRQARHRVAHRPKRGATTARSIALARRWVAHAGSAARCRVEEHVRGSVAHAKGKRAV